MLFTFVRSHYSLTYNLFLDRKLDTSTAWTFLKYLRNGELLHTGQTLYQDVRKDIVPDLVLDREICFCVKTSLFYSKVSAHPLSTSTASQRYGPQSYPVRRDLISLRFILGCHLEPTMNHVLPPSEIRRYRFPRLFAKSRRGGGKVILHVDVKTTHDVSVHACTLTNLPYSKVKLRHTLYTFFLAWISPRTTSWLHSTPLCLPAD